MRALRTFAALTASVWLLAAAQSAELRAAPVSFGDDFDFAAVNDGAGPAPEAPAFPADQAIVATTCDLGSGSTSEGGTGSAPTQRGHCLDVGGLPIGTLATASPWSLGEEPAWRLDPVAQAGAHPDGTAAFYFNYEPASGVPNDNVKNIVVNLPAGVVGNPEAVTKCSAVDSQAVPTTCAAKSQVGISTIAVPILVTKPCHCSYPVYAVEARDTITAEFLISNLVNRFNVAITARGRTNGDYGIDTLALLIPEYAPLGGQAFTFWGVPWAAEHDRFRIDGDTPHVEWFGGDSGFHLTGYPEKARVPYEADWGPIKPFFTNPTECTGVSPMTIVAMDSWRNPASRGGPLVTAAAPAEPVTGCDKLEFDPSIALKPTVAVSDSPSGLDVKLEIPQNNEPPAEALGNPNLPFDPADDTGAPAFWRTAAGLATAHLRDTTVSLPKGTSFNPAAANGLRGCTTAQVGLTATEPKVTFNNDPHQCPDTAKIGTLEIVSPLLPDPLQGAVYAAPQHDNPFPGSLTAIYMIAQDYERGLSIKLPGKVDLDPTTGQIATSFLDNPQLPFSTFELHFKTGPRAPLNTPATCGQFKNSSVFRPWSLPHSGPETLIEDPFDIDQTPNGQPCVSEPEDRMFAPGFEAGSTNTQAGAHTEFVLNVSRRDGDQELSGITLDMPPGLTARLAATPYCPDATLAAIENGRTGLEESNGSLCPSASELGAVHTLAGSGPLPLPTSGRLYLAGPFQGAPVSVAAIVPAIAGGVPGEPAFDLGNVVVRSGAHIDPRTAQVRVQSTKLPYILGGVPLRVRRASVQITKPGFMLNPTNCDPLSVGGSLGGMANPFDPADDTSTPVSSPFQVGNCKALGFKPRLKLRLKGATKRGKHPALIATLTARAGDANIARTSVAFPRSEFLENAHIRTICTRPDFAADNCPKGAIYGFASAWSPLLDQPLRGPVYLRSSDNLLPDLVADLRGPAHQPIRVELIGRTDSIRGGIRNTFDVVPDAPVSRFRLRMQGGNKGLLVNSRDICGRPYRATVKMAAQNGRRVTLRPKLVADCKKKGKKRKARRGGHKRGGKRR